MNQVTLIGNIANDLELKQTTNSKAVCQFNLAVSRYNDGADFIPIQVWGKQAENLVKFQQKGNKIGVIGRITVDSYDKNGEKRTFTKVVAHEVEFLQPKQQERTVADVRHAQNQSNPADYWMNNGFNSRINVTDEDLPF